MVPKDSQHALVIEKVVSKLKPQMQSATPIRKSMEKNEWVYLLLCIINILIPNLLFWFILCRFTYHCLFYNQKFCCVVAQQAKIRVCYELANEILMNDNMIEGKTTTLRSFIAELMGQYNDPNSDKITAVQKKVEDVKEIVVDSITLALNNMEKAEALVEKTNDLADIHARAFRNTTNEAKNNILWRWCIMIALLVFIVFVFVSGIAIAIVLLSWSGACKAAGQNFAPCVIQNKDAPKSK